MSRNIDKGKVWVITEVKIFQYEILKEAPYDANINIL